MLINILIAAMVFNMGFSLYWQAKSDYSRATYHLLWVIGTALVLTGGK